MRRLLIFALAAVLTVGAARADRLDGIRSAGTLRVAAFDSNPPFGFVDPATKTIAGLDLDYARAIADGIGVKLDVHPTNPANRIPLLVSGKVDLVLANFTASRPCSMSARSRWWRLRPSFVNQWAALIKDTSLAYVIGVPELSFVAAQVNNRTPVYPAEIFLFVGAVYGCLCLSLDRLASALARRGDRPASPEAPLRRV